MNGLHIGPIPAQDRCIPAWEWSEPACFCSDPMRECCNPADFMCSPGYFFRNPARELSNPACLSFAPARECSRPNCFCCAPAWDLRIPACISNAPEGTTADIPSSQIPISGYCRVKKGCRISCMWSGPLGLELFGKGPWPGAIHFILIRDGKVLCKARLRRSRTTCCRKFLAALRHHLLNTHYTDKVGKPTTLWELPEMKLLYADHKHHRRAASCWYTWHPVRYQPQTHIADRPRCPTLWGSEEPLPLVGIEFLEGYAGHMILLLMFPPNAAVPAEQQRQFYMRPLVPTGRPDRRRWTTRPHWLPMDPALTHTTTLVESTSGGRALVLQPLEPQAAVHGMPGSLQG